MSEGKAVVNITLEERTKSHPCYSGGCRNARMHLPVAPACNISCNYCNRRFDCVNESRPGVTSEVLKPEQALEKFLKVRSRISNLQVVGIAGPGDALANFAETKRTLELIRRADPGITFCLSTNGLYLPKYAAELARLSVTHVTVTINTVDPEIGAKIYREVNYEGVRYTGGEGAAILLKNQLEGLKKLSELGLAAKVNTVMIKDLNDSHIEEVAKKVKEYGVLIGNIMQLIPAPGSAFENMPLTTKKELNDLRKACGVHLKQMYHCQQCRADAIGSLGQDCSAEFRDTGGNAEDVRRHETAGADGAANAIRLAVATRDGRLVNIHFGHASEFYIYGYEAGKIELIEKRNVGNFCKGSDNCGDAEGNLTLILDAVGDCDIILSQRIGYYPQKRLEEQGKKVVQTYGLIHEEIPKAVEAYGREMPIPKAEGLKDDKKEEIAAPSMGYVAVASSDGMAVNEHFGSVKDFWIYEVFEGGHYRLIGRREASGGAAGAEPHAKAVRAAELLKDVKAVLALQIGKYAEMALESRGIKAFTVKSDIHKALQTYGRKSRLIKNLSVNTTKPIDIKGIVT